MQDEVFPDRDHFGRIFFNQATMSAAGHPADRRGAWAPARPAARTCRRCRDETVIVRDQGTIFLGGPPLVKAATGEVVTAEELGGGDVHARTSGVVDHLAADDARGAARSSARSSARSAGAAAPSLASRTPSRSPPRTLTTLYDVVPADTRTPYDVREVIRRIVDGSRLHEFKALYGETLVCGFARIWGYPVGIVANNGILFSESASRARTSSSCATSAASRWSSCRTSPASWSGASTRPAASPRTAPSW